jgi:predicted permease
MGVLMQDVKYGMRMLGKAPGFTAVAVLTLALGIGANTAIFSAVNGIILRPLPYAHPSELVTIQAHKMWKLGGEEIMGSVSLPFNIWEAAQKQTPAIAQMALYQDNDVTISGDGAPEKISAVYVSSDFFPLLGVRPLAGRAMVAGDTQAGAKLVAVASYALWRERWGGDVKAIGRTIVLDQKPYTLIGVMPQGFNFGLYSEPNGVWVANIPGPHEVSESSTAVARLKKGVTLQEVNVQLKTISPRFSKSLTVFGMGMTFGASSVEPNASDLNNALLILLGAVGFVLLIACVNVSGLLLARGWARQREVSIREALGATRARIVRQFLTESMLLALAGGAVGLLFSLWGVHILQIITPKDSPEHGQFLLNTNLLWFTVAVSLLVGILFGLAPAIQASARRVGGMVKESFGAAIGGSSGRRPRRLRGALVIIEVALAVILVIGATLVVRSFGKLMTVKLGFRTDHIVTMTANFGKSVCDPDDDKNFQACFLASQSVLERIRSISGVQSAAVASGAPLAGWRVLFALRIKGRAQAVSLDTGALIGRRDISSDYFRTFGTRLLAGRAFNDADVNGSPLVAIVNETFAEKYLDGKPLGKQISTDAAGHNKKDRPHWMEIVGEMSDSHDVNLENKASAEIFTPVGQGSYFDATTYIARTAADPAVMIPALRRAIWSVDKDAPITDVKTMDQLVAESVADQHFQAVLLSAFGVLGLLLAMIGIYGVISFSVTQRTREIGVRMALGAQPGDVLRMVIREGMLLAGAGIIVGVGGGLALTRFMRSLLFEVKPTDPATFAGVAAVLVIVALAACWIPARRAMKIEPMEALRYE